jgi:hypothetical protein
MQTAACGSGMRRERPSMCTTSLQVGDTIECRDAEDMIDTMFDLMHCGIETDFMYEKDGKKGLWLILTAI